MNPHDSAWQRLCRAAAGLAVSQEPPLAAEHRAMAAWRASLAERSAAQREWLDLAAWGRRGLAFACAVLLAAAAFSFFQVRRTAPDEWTLSYDLMNMALAR
jgi:hypothetical protein